MPILLWTDERLDDRLRSINEDVVEIRTDLRSLQGTAPSLAAMTARVDAAERDLRNVEKDVGEYINRSVTRQIVIVSSPLFLSALGVIVALATGHL